MPNAQLEYSLSVADELAKNCSSLFSYSPITNFGYIKVLNSGEMLHFSTNKKWLEHCYTTNVFDSPEYMQYVLKTVEVNKFYYFVKTGTPQDVVQSNQYQFGFWNSLIVAHRDPTCIELFAFHSSEANKPFNIYMNQSHTFKKFSLHFKDKFHSFIDLSHKKVFQRPNKLIASAKELFSISKQNDDFLAFQNSMEPIKKFYINESSHITLRQAQCISLLMRGMSAKEIARVLGISFKTVEHTLETVRHTFEMGNKGQLVSLLMKNDLHDILIKEQV